jgi:polysaccharide deacetylase family protein (PEP-CTERM system associated)
MVNNFLTFDIEEWFYGNFQSADLNIYEKSDLESNVSTLIDICAKYNIKSTCFIVGKLAKKKPYIVRQLQNAGHEIASHSFSHKLIYNMTPKEFNKDLKQSLDILENLAGEKIIGFRAPSWSVNKDIADWFYDILYENGLKYSSSVYPAKTYLYGIPDFPEKIHYPIVSGEKKEIIEIPQSLVKIFGKKIGFSGGFFLRLFPHWFIKNKISEKNKEGKSVFIYLHPHELNKIHEKTNLNFKESFILNHGVKGCKTKLENILNNFKHTFIPIKTYIKNLT